MFAARYRVTGDPDIERAVAPVGTEVVLPPEELRFMLATGSDATGSDATGSGPPVVLAGDGARRYAEVFATLAGTVLLGDQWPAPPAGVLARLGVARLSVGAGVDPGALSPRYLRAADTRINWQTRATARTAS